MIKKKTANRFRAIIAAIALTVSVNYAISYVATASPQSDRPEVSTERSGTGTVPNPPIKPPSRTGAWTVPDPPKP